MAELKATKTEKPAGDRTLECECAHDRSVDGRHLPAAERAHAEVQLGGFYMLEEGANPPALLLGRYQGAMTPHTRIFLNQGICGAAASSAKRL